MEVMALYKAGDLLVSRGRGSVAQIKYVSETHYLFEEIGNDDNSQERHWEHGNVERCFVLQPSKVQTSFWVAVYKDGSVGPQTYSSEEEAKKSARKRNLYTIQQFSKEVSAEA